MIAETAVSVEDYLKRSEKPNAEFVDGVVLPKSMPDRNHALLQGWICALIFRLFPSYFPFVELHSRLRPTEFRLPDVAVDLRSRGVEGYAEEPLYLCVEILSPGDRIGETIAKLERYHDWGVPYCWLIDPKHRRTWTYHKGGELLETSSQLEAGDIRLGVAEVFSILDAG